MFPFSVFNIILKEINEQEHGEGRIFWLLPLKSNEH